MTTPSDLLFGQIAIRRGQLTEDQLDLAVSEQEKARVAGAGAVPTLGAICVEKGFMTQEGVDGVLRDQRYTEARSEDKRLGELTIRNGLATREAVDECLAFQKAEHKLGRPAPRLGEVLKERGILDEQKLRALLARQSQLEGVGAAQEPAILPSPPGSPPVALPVGAKELAARMGKNEKIAFLQGLLSMAAAAPQITSIVWLRVQLWARHFHVGVVPAHIRAYPPEAIARELRSPDAQGMALSQMRVILADAGASEPSARSLLAYFAFQWGKEVPGLKSENLTRDELARLAKHLESQLARQDEVLRKLRVQFDDAERAGAGGVGAGAGGAGGGAGAGRSGGRTAVRPAFTSAALASVLAAMVAFACLGVWGYMLSWASIPEWLPWVHFVGYSMAVLSALVGSLEAFRVRRARSGSPITSLGGFVAGGAAAAFFLLAPLPEERPTEPSAPRAAASRDRNKLFSQIQRESDPAICFIYVEYRITVDGAVKHRAAATGTGFLVHPDGYVVTNKHVAFPWFIDPLAQTLYMTEISAVIESERHLWFAGSPMLTGAKELNLQASFNDKARKNLSVYACPPNAWRTEKVQLRKKGALVEGLTRIAELGGARDLTVLKIDWGVEPARPPVRIPHTGKQPEKLDPVMVLGFPLGTGPLQGRVAETSATLGEVRKAEDTIQVTAPTSHGNSGGPLFDADGEVIGITTRLGGDEQADLLVECMRFDRVREIVPELFEVGDDAATRLSRIDLCMERGRVRRAEGELEAAAQEAAPGEASSPAVEERKARIRAAQSRNDQESYLFLACVAANVAGGLEEPRVLARTEVLGERYLDVKELAPELAAAWKELKATCARSAKLPAAVRPGEVRKFREALVELGRKLATKHAWAEGTVPDLDAMDLLERARGRIQRRKFREALADLEEVKGRLPRSFLSEYLEGIARISVDEADQGRKLLEEAVAAFPLSISKELPDFHNLCVLLATRAFDEKRWEDAERWGTRVLDVYPNDPSALHARTLARAKLGRNEGAMEDARTWAATRAEDAEPQLAMARIYAAGFHDAERALTALERACQLGLKESEKEKAREMEEFKELRADPRFEQALGK
ncbi:MAG: trypsin-like peptidase domain-containing protein [Planctomycetes bacterium]|nr:trypsin-like peptidase domain-containing protein [Planctomycetota bacterium]